MKKLLIYNKQRIKNVLYFSLKYLLLLVSIVLIASVTLYYIQKKNKLKYLKVSILHNTEMVRVSIKRTLQTIISDLRILSEIDELQNILTSEKKRELKIYAFNRIMLLFSKNKKVYDQIRYIDEYGNERCRVNYNSGYPQIVRKNKLQNKKDRYYFKDAMKLSKGEIYISPLDLNIEHGRIEQPLKPMIRFATPVFDNNNRKRGIIILNFLAGELLNSISNLQLKYKHNLLFNIENKIYLLNSKGYWFNHENPKMNWGFMYPERKGIIFGNVYKEAWELISKNNNGAVILKDGIFAFSTFYPLNNVFKTSSGSSKAFSSRKSLKNSYKEYSWKIIGIIKKEALDTYFDNIFLNFLGYVSIFIIFVIIISLMAGNNRYIKNVAEKKIKSINSELQKNVNTKNKFFSIVAHDLKAPFTAILGLTNLLKKDFNRFDLTELKEIIDYINNSAEKLFKFIEQLLKWSRAQTGTLKLNPKKQNLKELATQIISYLHLSAINKEIEIYSEIHDNLIAYFDYSTISTVFQNLVSNAIKFTPNKGRITISGVEKKDSIEISVSDTGIGIKKENIPKIFEIDSSFSTQGTAGETGTGLGLVLCKEFIEKNSGKFWVKSEIGKGTSFYFTLPK